MSSVIFLFKALQTLFEYFDLGLHFLQRRQFFGQMLLGFFDGLETLSTALLTLVCFCCFNRIGYTTNIGQRLQTRPAALEHLERTTPVAALNLVIGLSRSLIVQIGSVRMSVVLGKHHARCGGMGV